MVDISSLITVFSYNFERYSIRLNDSKDAFFMEMIGFWCFDWNFPMKISLHRLLASKYTQAILKFRPLPARKYPKTPNKQYFKCENLKLGVVLPARKGEISVLWIVLPSKQCKIQQKHSQWNYRAHVASKNTPWG